jgi:AraC-like DNA-binding protein
MSIPMVNLIEFEHVAAVLDRAAGPQIVDRSLRAVGMRRKLLTAEPGFVPYAIEAAFIEAVARALGERQLGVRLGLAFDYAAYRSYARYIVGASNLAAAIARGERAQSLLHPGSNLVLRESGKHLVVGFNSGLRSVVGGQQIDQAAIPVLISAARHFLGPTWVPDWIEMTDCEQKHLSDFEDIIGTPIRSGAQIPALAIRMSDLLVPNPAIPKPEDAVMFSDLPVLLAVRHLVTAEDAVKEALRTQFVLGDLSEEAVSERLLMGPRKMRRVLKAEGTSFREIREQFLDERARLLLADTDLSIAEIARSLGYSEPNNFRRAFRNWTGLSPREYRAVAISKASSSE